MFHLMLLKKLSSGESTHTQPAIQTRQLPAVKHGDGVFITLKRSAALGDARTRKEINSNLRNLYREQPPQHFLPFIAKEV